MDNKTLHRIASKIAAEVEENPTDPEELGVNPRWAQLKTKVQSDLKPIIKQLRIIIGNEDERALVAAYEQLIDHMAVVAKLMGMTSVKNKLTSISDTTFD